MYFCENVTPEHHAGLKRRGEGRRDRGESRLIEMVLQHARRVYVHTRLVFDSCQGESRLWDGIDFGWRENSFHREILKPDIKRRGDLVSDGATQRDSTVDHPQLRENSS